VFKITDGINNAQFTLGIKTPGSPWESVPSNLPSSVPTATVLDPKKQTDLGRKQIENQWILPLINGAGTSSEAGIWVPYIIDKYGQVVAYKTFVQPDLSRPYSITAIVAFDLRNTRLNFVLGTEEPYAPDVPHRGMGTIPEIFKKPGTLLAAFNGGFQFEQGGFGAFANGFQSAPPISGLGTLAIYNDGKVRIGAWGKEIVSSKEMIAFRQNGPPLIYNGAISNLIDNPKLWGLTVKGEVVTWRSGIALSKDENTLYYLAGPSLTVSSLANTMSLLHAENAIELDINDYWVIFDAFTEHNGEVVPDPLFPIEMKKDAARFLAAYKRDFFYITTREP
jgi:hypothetical protein